MSLPWIFSPVLASDPHVYGYLPPNVSVNDNRVGHTRGGSDSFMNPTLVNGELAPATHLSTSFILLTTGSKYRVHPAYIIHRTANHLYISYTVELAW